MQAMGRKIGFIPAAARLADPDRRLPLHIYLAESGVTLEQLADGVSDELRREGRCLVVLSEGFNVGDTGQRRDSFGHVQFSSSGTTAAQVVTNYLNEKGLPVGGAVRCNVPGTDQRHNMAYASTVDLDEAYRVGQKAAEIAVENGGGWMATILREAGSVYRARFDKVPLEEMANSERKFPKAWITPNGRDVTDAFLAYARPLIGEDWPTVPLVDGLQRFARFQPIFADKKCNPYVPEATRKK
jgi:ATP-dependent phosphofructokinase / diphosphate-dependent phosphofructokinase